MDPNVSHYHNKFVPIHCSIKKTKPLAMRTQELALLMTNHGHLDMLPKYMLH